MWRSDGRLRNRGTELSGTGFPLILRRVRFRDPSQSNAAVVNPIPATKDIALRSAEALVRPSRPHPDWETTAASVKKRRPDMMKRLLMTTAAASLLALGSAAYAQNATD